MSRWIGLLLAVVVLFENTTARAQITDPQELAKKAVEAAGGADKLPKALRWSETWFLGTDPTPHPRDALIGPPKTWIQNGTNIADGNADRTEKTYLVWAWTLAPLIEKDSRFTILPERKVADRPADGLKLERDDGPPIELYFDRETHRLAMVCWRKYDIDFAEWKEVDGFHYPSKAFVRRKDGTLHLWTEFKKFEKLEKLP